MVFTCAFANKKTYVTIPILAIVDFLIFSVIKEMGHYRRGKDSGPQNALTGFEIGILTE